MVQDYSTLHPEDPEVSVSSYLDFLWHKVMSKADPITFMTMGWFQHHLSIVRIILYQPQQTKKEIISPYFNLTLLL